jgi:hypothetical protein
MDRFPIIAADERSSKSSSRFANRDDDDVGDDVHEEEGGAGLVDLKGYDGRSKASSSVDVVVFSRSSSSFCVSRAPSLFSSTMSSLFTRFFSGGAAEPEPEHLNDAWAPPAPPAPPTKEIAAQRQ